MSETVYTQNSNREYPFREVVKFVCTHCGKMKLHKNWIDTKGNKGCRNIVVDILAKQEWEEIESSCTEKHEESYPQKDSIFYGKTFVNRKKDGTIEVKHGSYSTKTDKLHKKWKPGEEVELITT